MLRALVPTKDEKSTKKRTTPKLRTSLIGNKFDEGKDLLGRLG